MKEIEFKTYGSALHRDGLPTHAMLLDGVAAICGASGVSFTEDAQYKRNTDGSFFVMGNFGPRNSVNPITCKKCLGKLFPVMDEYHKLIPTEVGEYRYMGHWITDQRDWKSRGLAPWSTRADTLGGCSIPHYAFLDAKAHCKNNRVDDPHTQVSDYI